MIRRDILSLMALAAAPTLTAAQSTSPDRVVRIISGFAAGSPIDAAARLFAPMLEKHVNARVIVDYKVGAGGRIGNTSVKQAKPDGTTIAIASSSLMAIYPHIFKKLAYDPLRDFVPITSVVDWEYGITVSTRVPESVRTLADYVEWLRKNPDEGHYGVAAAGSIPHFLGTTLSQLTKLRLVPVPYPGSAPHMQALNSAQVPMGIDPLSGIIPHLGSGRIRLLATSGNERSVPDVPTCGFRSTSTVFPATWTRSPFHMTTV